MVIVCVKLFEVKWTKFLGVTLVTLTVENDVTLTVCVKLFEVKWAEFLEVTFTFELK